MTEVLLSVSWPLADEDATASLAQAVARALPSSGLRLELHGPLGAGKSCFSRALLRQLGVTGRIKSPTYSLVESYPWQHGTAWHLDLYRIADPGELEWLGLEALADPGAIVLVEWPEQGRGMLPPSDLRLDLAYAGEARQASLRALSPHGAAILQQLC